ncbi:cytochrome ubiquinol oxidase subunit I, partial [Streptomyces sp. SID6013]|nr:cytochrome ubiquinol oxidase subunit I [Streptomyces sp. SID6013]
MVVRLSPRPLGTLRRMAVDRRTGPPRRTPARQRTNRTLGRVLVRWATTTDHKVIGRLYLATSFGFFVFAGVLAMLMRSELARPGLQLFSSQQYNQLFTVHGTIMMLLFATPLFAGFTNAIMP